MTSPSNADHKPILTERFKTKPCRNFLSQGHCPYEQRCMFAHGEADLRTKEMNVAAGLTSEEAIKAFQRAAYASAHDTDATPLDEEPAPIIDTLTHHANGTYSHNPYAKFTVMPATAPRLIPPQAPVPPPPVRDELAWGSCGVLSSTSFSAMPPPPKYVPEMRPGSRVLVP